MREQDVSRINEVELPESLAILAKTEAITKAAVDMGVIFLVADGMQVVFLGMPLACTERAERRVCLPIDAEYEGTDSPK